MIWADGSESYSLTCETEKEFRVMSIGVTLERIARYRDDGSISSAVADDLAGRFIELRDYIEREGKS